LREDRHCVTIVLLLSWLEHHVWIELICIARRIGKVVAFMVYVSPRDVASAQKR